MKIIGISGSIRGTSVSTDLKTAAKVTPRSVKLI